MITPSFVRYWCHNIDTDLGIFSTNPYLTPSLIDELVGAWNCCDATTCEEYWNKLSSNPCLTKEIIDRYVDRWDWYVLSWNECIFHDLSIIDHYIDRWDWYGLSRNDGLIDQPISVLEKYQNRWQWWILSQHLTLTIEKIQHFYDRWILSNLLLNSSLTSAMLDLFHHRMTASNWFFLNGAHHIAIDVKQRYVTEIEQALIEEMKLQQASRDDWVNFAKHGYLTVTILDFYAEAEYCQGALTGYRKAPIRKRVW